MKPDIHPKALETTFSCACGNTTTVLSTIGGKHHLEVCSECHPFYTGKEKLVDTAGRIEKFQRRYATAQAAQEKVAKDAAKKKK